MLNVRFKLNKRRYSLIMNIGIILSIIFLPIFAYPGPGNLKEAIDLLSSANWMERSAGAMRLSELADIDLNQKVEILVNSLRNEIDAPLSMDMAEGSYMTINEYLKNQYCLTIKGLGTSAKETIIKSLNSTSGELKSRLMIILGLLGEKVYKNDIRKIYYSSEDGYLRLFALRALISFGDLEDVPLFKDALNDEFQAYNNSDVVGRNKNIYIIRMDAAGILGMLGYKLKAMGDGYIILSEPEQEKK